MQGALSGKVAIVTGAGRGIGKAIALGFAGAGADVVAAARTVTEIEETAAEVRALGRKTLAVPTDVRDEAQVSHLRKTTLEAFGRVDILVNNAGHNAFAPVRELTFEAWDAMLRENLTSIFICCRVIGEAMVRQGGGGSIINMSSLAGLTPLPRGAPYAAAKAGVISLTQTLAVEFAPHNVRVNALAPGIILTLLSRQLSPPDSPYRQAQLRCIPLGRFGTVEDIVGAAVFLSSDGASYITGETIPIEGGLTTTVIEQK